MEGNDPMAPEGNLFRDPHVKTGGKKRTQKNSRKTTRNAKKKGTQDLEFAQNWFRIQKKKMNQSCGRKPNGNRGQRPIKSMRRRWQGWGGRGGGGGGDEATAMREGGMTKVKEWVFFFFFVLSGGDAMPVSLVVSHVALSGFCIPKIISFSFPPTSLQKASSFLLI